MQVVRKFLNKPHKTRLRFSLVVRRQIIFGWSLPPVSALVKFIESILGTALKKHVAKEIDGLMWFFVATSTTNMLTSPSFRHQFPQLGVLKSQVLFNLKPHVFVETRPKPSRSERCIFHAHVFLLHICSFKHFANCRLFDVGRKDGATRFRIKFRFLIRGMMCGYPPWN